MSTKQEALTDMVLSRWLTIAALGYQQFKAEGRGIVIMLMPQFPQAFGGKVQVNLDYVAKGGAKWLEQDISEEVTAVVDAYDPARAVVVGIVHPNDDVDFALFETPEGKPTPAAAFVAGHAPPRLS